MKSLGVILARGASKRLPRKNVRPLAGLPLVGWSCRAALASKIDRVVLSTEDDEIAAIGAEQGMPVPFMRPQELAEDFARDTDIVFHAIEACQEIYSEQYDVLVLIQATTPFVLPEHLDACVEKLREDNLSCVFAARKASEHPRWMWVVGDDGQARPYTESVPTADEQHGQNLSSVFYPSGAAWAARIEEVRKQGTLYCAPLGLVEMPWENAVDIDNEQDWMRAESVIDQHGIEPVLVPASRMQQQG